MKNKLLVITTLAICVLLTACGHKHVWQDANCTSPMYCPECGEVVGEAKGHFWEDASCEKPKTCTVCAITEGAALGHDWKDATCVTPKTCANCGKTDGDALGHAVETWNTVEESTCALAGTQTGICPVCSETVEMEIPLKEHSPGEWNVTIMPTESTQGTREKKCTVCDQVLETEKFSLSAEELKQLYKSECKTISYDSLSRTPDEYKGEKVKFTGRVLQVCSEASSALYYSTYRVATSGRYDNVMYIYVDNYGSGTRILEDDWITFYGEYDGLYSYETVMGANMTIPSVKAKYVD